MERKEMEKRPEEISEIERHKYFLSEKKGYDVGWEFAEHDWEQNFAVAWRKQQHSASEQCSNSNGTSSSVACAELARVNSADHKKPSRIRSLLARVFSNSH